MIIRLYTYEVPVGKQSEYLKATAEKIKPFWESHGCKSYNVWQAAEGGTSFLKPMFFEDMAAMEKAMALPEAKPIVDLFKSFAINSSSTVYIQKA